MNEKFCLCICFSELYFFYWFLVVTLVISIAVPFVFSRSMNIACRSTVQYRKWSPTANDPESANDPQNGPKMILDRKSSSKSTANDPERKIGMAWTQVSGSSCKFYYYYKKSDYKLNFTSQINTRIKTKWKKSFKCKNEVGRQHTTFTSCQNAACSNEFFFWRVDYTSEGRYFFMWESDEWVHFNK